jgi:hypothetical protein
VAEFWINLASILGALLALGACFVLLARWSRRRNAQLERRYGDASQRGAVQALVNRRWREYFELNFFGTLPSFQERLAKFLMGIVILFVAAVVVSVAWLMWPAFLGR